MSLPSPGVTGVRPLLESSVELAGLYPRVPNTAANGFWGAVIPRWRDAIADLRGGAVVEDCVDADEAEELLSAGTLSVFENDACSGPEGTAGIDTALP